MDLFLVSRLTNSVPRMIDAVSNPKGELRALPALHNSTAIRVLTSCFTLMQSGRQLHPTLDRTPICARSAVRIGRGSFRSPEWMGTVQHVDAGDPELILLGYM
jgi:hypothetical protein